MNEFVLVSGSQNPPDKNGIGCVPYAFEIAKYAISNEDWCGFLNAVGKRAMGLGLWHKDMETGVLGGINHDFTVKPGWEKKPVTYITYTGVMWYCNWRMTGDTEKGAYDLSVTPPRRLEGAKYFLPTNDEWYKAAYWDAAAKRYWKYPTRSDELPRQDQANYERGDVLAVGAPYYLADVDAYVDSPSPCGALQMGGNVWEFLEDCFRNPLGNKLRGGSFGYTETGLSSANVDFGKYDKRCYVFGARICRMKDGWRPCAKPLKYVIIQKNKALLQMTKAKFRKLCSVV